MKITYVYDAIYPWVKGGAEKRIYELSRRLALRGHEVHCYGMKWWEGERDICQEDVHLHGICAPMKLYSGGRRSMREAAYFASKIISMRDGSEVVDCQNFPYIPCIPAKLLSSLKRQEFFITWHEVWGDYWYEYLGRKGLLGKWAERGVSRLTDKNIAVSEMTRRDLEGLGVEGVQVVPNGIDFSEMEQLKASDRESDIIYAGRLARHKNVDLLIRSVGIIRRDIPDIRAIIIGDGPEMDRLRGLTRELKLEGNIEFTGFFENYNDALALMKSSKVFVSPSTREGFGMAALEANACGLPVVTVDHRMNAVCDFVTGETGLICKTSAESIAEAIITELDSGNSVWERCIESAKSYDWERICDLAETIYRF